MLFSVTMSESVNKICQNYNIPCPYALEVWSELPCFVPSQEACDKFRKMYKELPEETKKGILKGRLVLDFGKK